MKRIGTHAYFLVVFWCFCLFQFDKVYPITEKEILLQFKGNISIDPYNSLRSWDPSKSPCQDYSGVFCNSDGNVVKIVLWNTSLGGELSAALSGLKSLRTLTLYGNRFTGNIPSAYGEISSLWKMNLSSNALSGSIPEFIGDLPNIRFLDLSRNGFTGKIPSALFDFCNKTRFISLSHNNLSGAIPASIENCQSLEGLDFSFNSLTGSFISQICDIPRLVYLSLRRNMLAGSVQEQLSSCQRLQFLDLGSNMFTGVAPFGVLSLENLIYFNISSNSFQPEALNIGTCSQRLEFLDVSRNGFYGEIPSQISKCSALKYLDVGYNKLSGTIPLELVDLKGLLVFRLANNLITGTIPAELGSIEWLQVLDLHNLRLSGEIPEELSNCRFLLDMDISENFLQGEIPQKLYNISYLVNLDLHQNQLTGNIPTSIGNLSNLHSLDLSENRLSGSIPFSLVNLKSLNHFNVSYNSLSGEIPSIESLQQFGPSAFFHNSHLCGSPLDSCFARKPKLSASAIVAIVAAALILSGLIIVAIVNTKARRRRRRRREEAMIVETTSLASTDSNVVIGKLVLFSTSLPSKHEDWKSGKALLDKERVIGGGSIGTVYRTSFEGGVSMAVKRLKTSRNPRNQEVFEHEIGQLGNLGHPNLIAIQGYYWSSSMQLILSEFAPNGNLYENLHRVNYNPELSWPRRFQIALGTARALAYLHHDCKPQVLHLNVKSTNVLLGRNYEAKLSDYGLVKLLPLLDNYSPTKFHNAVGYVAPELAQSLRFSDKCDVYSFGVILLELVTGRKPVESPVVNEVVVLCEYVRRLIERGAASACFDRGLRGFVENELIQVMKLGLICTCEVPSRRPNMAEVVQVLESIRNGSES
ncbi:PREDICTED: probable LRR receptor-like serine/threonine-protein kinase At1g12460 isoform X1 [Ipomoea nil]|uniref:probable LRR receptor-like serine/threonine-protein kinase At1g12460 isoform X1 n=1 Tax=Ipomoea nil TaxID=35883 RepID=UPI000901E2DA|nr:PREDICTED: probable LRR receptor-like serine/threonine-protein kinase At1g12460 isoform X1 [Ipomoea nil]